MVLEVVLGGKILDDVIYGMLLIKIVRDAYCLAINPVFVVDY